MMKILMLGLTFSLFCFGFFACQNAENQASMASIFQDTEPWPPKLAWDLKPVAGINVEEGDNPQTIIGLKVGPKAFALDTITGIAQILEPEDAQERGVPKSAWSACGGFYAGLGVYYYVQVKKERKIEVWIRYEEESYYDEEIGDFVQPEQKWELKRVIEPKDLK